MKLKSIYLIIFYLIISAGIVAAQDKKNNLSTPKQTTSNTPAPAESHLTPGPTPRSGQQGSKAIPQNYPSLPKPSEQNSATVKRQAELKQLMQAKDVKDKKEYEEYLNKKRAQKEAQERAYDQRVLADKAYEQRRLMEKEIGQKQKDSMDAKFKK